MYRSSLVLLLLAAACNQPALSSSFVAGCTCTSERNSLSGLQGLTTDSTYISWIRSSATFSYVETAALGYGASTVISSVLTFVGSASTLGASNGSPGSLGNAPPTLCTNASDNSVLIADPGNSAVRRAKRSGAFTGTLSTLGVQIPGAYGVAVLGDTAFVSLMNAHHIVCYSAASTTLAPFAGDFAGVTYAYVQWVARRASNFQWAWLFPLTAQVFLHPCTWQTVETLLYAPLTLPPLQCPRWRGFRALLDPWTACFQRRSFSSPPAWL